MAAKWMPTSRISRAVTPTKLILEGATAAAIAKARLLRGGHTAEMTADLAADPRLARTAERLARELGDMKGAAMKLGQILSFIDAGVLPPEYRDAFAALQADAPPMPYEMVEQIVASELGAPPDELFTHFSRQPIASASIGQVHMAHRGGEELVLKVQYPGVTEAIEADLRNAALFALLGKVVGRLLAGVAGRIDTTAVIEELRARITEELDYRIEARNQQAFAELWRDDPAVHVPEVVPQLSTRRVITSRYADGNRWSYALEAPASLRNLWGTAIARFQWVSLFRDGFTNLDPHPGNYLFHEDGTVTFLDFGACQRFDASQLHRLAGLIDAVVVGSDEAIVDALVDFGLVTSPGSTTFDHTLITRPVRLAVEPAMHEDQPFRFAPTFVADQVGQAVRLRFGSDELRLLQQLDVPIELPMVLRITLGTAGLLSRLDTAVDFRAVIDEALARETR